jgi:hypothetical protein
VHQEPETAHERVALMPKVEKVVRVISCLGCPLYEDNDIIGSFCGIAGEIPLEEARQKADLPKKCPLHDFDSITIMDGRKDK